MAVSAGKTGSTIRVLVADDSAAYREAAMDAVGGLAGFEVVGAARSGHEAVRVTCELQPDLVLMDVRMDGLDGVGAARAILAHEPTTVVVLMSARPEALPAGADSCGAIEVIDKRDLGLRTLSEIWQRHGRRSGAAPRGGEG